MKEFIKFLRNCRGLYFYSIAFCFAFYYNDRLFMGVCGTLILWNISSYFHEKINNEYITWLEDRADHWYQKYKEEKYGKKEESKTEKIVICKN